LLAKNSKWLDSDKFGINYAKGKIEAWYSIKENQVALFENQVG